MTRPDCACVHPDAARCLEWRNPTRYALESDDEPECGREERCECCCHDADDDCPKCGEPVEEHEGRRFCDCGWSEEERP